MVKRILTIKTRYGAFRCSFEPEKDMGGYTAEARGVSGALSWGKTFTEAKKMIVQAIEGAVEANAIAEAEERGAARITTTLQTHLALA